MSGPLFRFDAGWLFVAAGLAVCAAGVVLPAQGDLRALQQQLDTLRAEEARAYARLKAYNDFLDQLDEEDPALVRRLAASQLNIVPASDRPVLLSTAQIAPVTNWIEATVAYEPSRTRMPPESTLSRLASGPSRLWLFAGGIMCVFIGLLMGPGAVRRAGLFFSRSRGEDSPAVAHVANENLSAAAVLEAPSVEQLVLDEGLSTSAGREDVVDALAAEIDAELDVVADRAVNEVEPVILEVELAATEEADSDDELLDVDDDEDAVDEAFMDIDDKASEDDDDENDDDDSTAVDDASHRR